MKINFILPFKARKPAGGFRVMYEYANQLSIKGYDVHLTYPIQTKYMEYRFPYPIRKILTWVEGFRTGKWFNFHPAITMEYIPCVQDKYVKDADIVIATWWTTAVAMSKLSPSKGAKINLIQGYENWTGRENELFESYNLPNTTNVVVASYLRDIVQKYSSTPVELIHNAIDNKQFHISKPIEERNPLTIGMTYSLQEIKGSIYGLEALKLAQKKHSELTVHLFGICPEPDGLPEWIIYHHNPSNLNEVYNSCSIFLSNSFTEGFPLTPAEAMFAGCALICTDIDGHREYATENETALFVKVKDSKTMADRISYLIDNNGERVRIAKSGNEYIQKFRWYIAVEKMEAVIKNIAKK